MTDASTTSLLARSDGVTDAERYLTRLARQSFLSLWSYPGVYRDQGNVVRGGDGKEICDLLVVFDNHLIIFSDKDCAFPDTGDLDLDWSRWYRKAIAKSAQQVWTGERWIRQYPDRLFLDRKCQQPFPIDMPQPETMKVHRILVAHGASERCKQELGGSGSLMIMPDIIDERHCVPRSQGGIPFAIGQVDPDHGYYHIFDDTTLDIVMNTLDTITDFVEYLEKKEHFITSGQLGGAAGEEELLAFYLGQLNVRQEHDFVVPTEASKIFIDESWWHDFENSPERKAQLEANRVSYFWDHLIELFLHHVYAGTSQFLSHPGLANQERVFRLLAREDRTRRRFLSQSLLEWVARIPANYRGRRVIKPTRPEEPHYVFLLVPHVEGISYEDYRDVRRGHLEQCCRLTKVEAPEAIDIIGIATEAGRTEYGSEDVVYFDAREWTSEEQKEAEELRSELIRMGIIGEQRQFRRNVKEYPDLPVSLRPKQRQSPMMKGRDRNKLCPCHSGRKWKDCCG